MSGEFEPKIFIEKVISNATKEGQLTEQSLNLTANENRMSSTAAAFLTTGIEARYELGEPDSEIQNSPYCMKGDLMYENLPYTRNLIRLGMSALANNLNANYVDGRSLSGVHAMGCTILSFTEPGDTVWSLSPRVGGHFATSFIIERCGRKSRLLDLCSQTLDFNFEQVDDFLKDGDPKMVFIDQSLCIHPLSLEKLRKRLGKNTICVFDASHVLGLIFGGMWPNPLNHGFDILQGNTHKTFPGPQKAIIAAKTSQVGEKLKRMLSGGLLSSQHTHHTLALAVTALEMHDHGQNYARAIVENSVTLTSELARAGFQILKRAGENVGGHIVLARPGTDIDAYRLCQKLLEVGIRTNARKIDGNIWLRIGTQEVSRLGAGRLEMQVIGRIISSLAHSADPKDLAEFVKFLKRRVKRIHFGFDEMGRQKIDLAIPDPAY